MQAALACELLALCVKWEYTLQVVSTDKLHHYINRRSTAASDLTATSRLRVGNHIGYLGAELHKKLLWGKWLLRRLLRENILLYARCLHKAKKKE
jgi:hypothetical protein